MPEASCFDRAPMRSGACVTRNGFAAEVVKGHGPDGIGIFTGNSRYFPLQSKDLPTLCEEWVGPGMFMDVLRETAVSHLGGDGTEGAAVFNRTSAGIVAGILALSVGRPVVSVVPDGDRSHASVTRGCAPGRSAAGRSRWQRRPRCGSSHEPSCPRRCYHGNQFLGAPGRRCVHRRHPGCSGGGRHGFHG